MPADRKRAFWGSESSAAEAIAGSTRGAVVPMRISMLRLASSRARGVPAPAARGAARLWRGHRARPGAGRELLRWRDVLGAVAAEVGEPEGVRTIVFDLLAQASRGERVALRLDVEPGEPAAALAQVISAALGERARASIKSLAADGIATLWFPDLASFEEVASGELGDSVAGRFDTIARDGASRRRPDPVRGLLLPLPRDLPGRRRAAVCTAGARSTGAASARASAPSSRRVWGCRSRPARTRKKGR